MEANECAERIMECMDQFYQLKSIPIDTDVNMSPDPNSEQSDIWFEIINNELEPRFCNEIPEYTKPICYLCNLALEECLLQCTHCADFLCYHGPYEQKRTRPCVVLQQFAPEADKGPTKLEIEQFVCPHCWKHSEEGLYPHFVKSAPVLTARQRDKPAPRMVMLIYFLDPFWPQAKHLRKHVLGQWNGCGWPCFVEPIKLENLDEQRAILEDIGWEPKTFNLYIIYITHGLSESKTYQISHNLSCAAPEFLDRTLVPAQALAACARYRLAIFDIKKKQNASIFRDIDLLSDAVEHISRVLRPLERCNPPSNPLYVHVQLYKQHLDAAITDYECGAEYRHYCYFLFDLSYEIKPEDEDKQLVASFRKHNDSLKETKKGLKVRKKKMSLTARQRKLHKLAVEAGLCMVGHTQTSAPSNVYCMDAITHEKLDPRSMLIKGIDNETGNPERVSKTLASRVQLPSPNQARGGAFSKVDLSVPLPANENPFGDGFVETEVVEKAGFKVLSTGTVYGFARAPDGTYSMVFAAQFCPLDSLSDVEKEAANTFADFVPKAAAHAYEVKGNKAQNMGKKRCGRLYSTGWCPGTTHGEMVAEYTAQSEKDKHNPTHYIDLYNRQEAVNSAWMIMQEALSPRAVIPTVNTLADTAVPMFGSHSSDIVTHGPSLGSNMAVSMTKKGMASLMRDALLRGTE
ncbi:hypothetical protein RSOL_064760 [Rhizoctonia solani AG-3 Rhs1AP]|uniref:Tet-like 2OG-Fe(II) oxygenase domain-containing protein n=1 Tax=Rhizoctonia solani AG-3 Rhs1AP TaxID=1086054 RepID=X8J088_9AGAM|nr:hypothetical protein RSOL_064760 [Rhizoctonia solani AG-3 Rhs1AP]